MAENDDLDLGEEKKSSKKWLFIVLAVVLLLGGGGATLYFLKLPPFGKTETSETAEAEEGDEAPNDEEEDEDSTGPKTARFHDFAPFVVNFPRGGGARLFQVGFSVMAYDEETIEAVAKHEPMIRNNLLLLLGRYKPEDLRTPQGKEALRQAIVREVQKVLDLRADGGTIETVFFTQFVMQ